MHNFAFLALGFCLAGIAWGDRQAHPDLTGTWQVDTSKTGGHSGDLVWTIAQKDNGTIHFTAISSNKQDGADFECTTRGQDCEVKERGKIMKVAFWYNGPLLVESETGGHNGEWVTKKRMKLSEDGSTLSVEIEHLAPSGPPETLVLHKQK